MSDVLVVPPEPVSGGPDAAASNDEVAEMLGLFDLGRIDSLLRGFSEATGIASALILLDGRVVLSANWRRICTDFHRPHPEAGRRCLASDTMLASSLTSEGVARYTCLNGLTDAAAAVSIGGRHVANAFVGQFFERAPDLARFRRQAARYGFDEDDYLEAVAEVPVLPVEKIRPVLQFLTSTTEILGNMGLEVLKKDKAERRLRRTLDRLSKSVDAAVGALALTVEMRDPYTAGHQQRVADLAVAIGEKLRITKRERTSLRLAALIHDIGKISVPAEVLSKPGALTESEWGLIREHPEAGYSILHDMRFPGPVATIVRQHHERLDGSGYPAALSGEQIRRESRVLAVADVVEAMSSHRPYRAALGIDAALDEVTSRSGVLYDREAVEACVSLSHEDHFAFPGQGRAQA